VSSLAEEFPKEQARVRKLLGIYKDLGAPGVFGAAILEQTLQRANQAAVSGDVIAMLRSYEELKGCK
jgi:hypothetical protein